MQKPSNSFSFQQWFRTNGYWIVFIMLALVGVGYSIYRGSSQDYWDGAIGNWLATLLGIVAGVPIALTIERQRLSREELERAIERKERAAKVLALIRDELIYNSERFAERLRDKSSLPIRPLKIDLWQALSDSGEIGWIDNLPILSGISSAYHYIKVVAAIEDKCYQAIRGINPKYDDGTFASQRLLEDARKFNTELGTSISSAIRIIEEIVEGKSAG